ncbi:leucine-rich repeat and WD repeat-containing protein 1 [Platysternon megacephalum]|uniref:Leucine-rich repeat and WD repeat-containing protein 1 n=1 Tax=Platysternon megacephalum TaxID=55544 RepID=A0A4D9ER29_9SAUR|nr:leucine-rich repeat and WD repeat-containing protein 1 [Platysternon megacephalum]
MDSNSNTVVVTGFGPFRQHLVNSSWEAVKVMSKLGLGENIDLHIMQLPVAYQKAKELVCKIWGTLQLLVSDYIVEFFSLKLKLNQIIQCLFRRGIQLVH